MHVSLLHVVTPAFAVPTFSCYRIPVHATQPGTVAIYLGALPSAVSPAGATNAAAAIQMAAEIGLSDELVNNFLHHPMTRVALVPVLPAESAQELCGLLPTMAKQIAGPSPVPHAAAATWAVMGHDASTAGTTAVAGEGDGMRDGSSDASSSEWGGDEDEDGDKENAPPVAAVAGPPSRASWTVVDEAGQLLPFLQLPLGWQGMLSHAWQHHFSPLCGDLDLLLAYASTLPAHAAARPPSNGTAAGALLMAGAPLHRAASASLAMAPPTATLGLHHATAAPPGMPAISAPSCSHPGQPPSAYASPRLDSGNTLASSTPKGLAPATSLSSVDAGAQRVLLTSIVQFLLANGLHQTAAFLLRTCSIVPPAVPEAAAGSSTGSIGVSSTTVASVRPHASSLPWPVLRSVRSGGDQRSSLYGSSAGSTAYLSCSPGSPAAGHSSGGFAGRTLSSYASHDVMATPSAARTPLAFAMAVQELRTKWQAGAGGHVGQLVSSFALPAAGSMPPSGGDTGAGPSSFLPCICAPRGGAEASCRHTPPDSLMVLAPADSGSCCHSGHAWSQQPLRLLPATAAGGMSTQSELPSEPSAGTAGNRQPAFAPIQALGLLQQAADHEVMDGPLVVMSPPYTPAALSRQPGSQHGSSSGGCSPAANIELSPTVSLASERALSTGSDSPVRMRPLLSPPTSASTVSAPLHPNYAVGRQLFDPAAACHLAGTPGTERCLPQPEDFCFSPVPKRAVPGHGIQATGTQHSSPLAHVAHRSSWQQWQQATCSQPIDQARPSAAGQDGYQAAAGAHRSDMQPLPDMSLALSVSGSTLLPPLSMAAGSTGLPKPSSPQGAGTPKGLRMALRLLGGCSPASSPSRPPSVLRVVAGSPHTTTVSAPGLDRDQDYPLPVQAPSVHSSSRASLQLPVVLPVVPYQLPPSRGGSSLGYRRDQDTQAMGSSLLSSAFLIPDDVDAEHGSGGCAAGTRGSQRGLAWGPRGGAATGSRVVAWVQQVVAGMGRTECSGVGWAVNDFLALLLCIMAVVGLVLLIVKIAVWAM